MGVAEEAGKEKKKPAAVGVPVAAAAAAAAAPATAETKVNKSAELLKALGELADGVGQLQHSCKPKFLTETEAEYTVQVVKHMFPQHVVLEMVIHNTLQGVTLDNIEVQLTLPANWTEIGASTIPKLVFDQKASAYSVLQKNSANEAGVLTGSIGATLKFIMKEDGDDLGSPDDYPIESCGITVGDYMMPRPLPQGQFKSVWEELSAQGVECTQKMLLPQKSLEPAVAAIIANMNMDAADRTGAVEAGSKGHTLNMSGAFVGGTLVLVRALVGQDANHGIVCKISARCRNQVVADTVSRMLM